MAFEKTCGPCSGHGYYGLDPKATCKVCSGTGEITLPGQEDDYKPCGPCSGHGYYGLDSLDTCGVCKGLGVIVRASRVPASVPSTQTTAVPHDPGKWIFLVHGRNTTVRDRVDLYLTKELGLRVKVMAAEAHGGRTLPEKFEEVARQCSFAVFLMTGDDVLQTADGDKIHRARQNVVLEIGYFWGALGRRGRVAFLVDSGLDLSSDVHGVGWIPITADLGETMLRLRKELEDAGVLRAAGGEDAGA